MKADSPFGLNIIIVYHILSIVAWLGIQTQSLWRYEEFASWSMPEIISSCYDVSSEVAIHDYPLGTQIVAVVFADFVVLLPFIMTATVGLINRDFYGVVISWMIFGINVYRTMMIFWQATMSNQFAATGLMPIMERSIIYVNLFFSVWAAWYQCRCFQPSIRTRGENRY